MTLISVPIGELFRFYGSETLYKRTDMEIYIDYETGQQWSIADRLTDRIVLIDQCTITLTSEEVRVIKYIQRSSAILGDIVDKINTTQAQQRRTIKY
jgi:hypothetical protein